MLQVSYIGLSPLAWVTTLNTHAHMYVHISTLHTHVINSSEAPSTIVRLPGPHSLPGMSLDCRNHKPGSEKLWDSGLCEM